MQILAKILFILSSCAVFLILPAILLTYLTPYYLNAFTRYDVYANFAGQNYFIPELDARFTHVLANIQPPFMTELEPEFFSPEDIAHMHDVQSVFKALYMILIISLVVQFGSALILWQQVDYSQLLIILNQTQQVTAILLALLLAGAIIALANWDSAFTTFHQLLFPHNAYWMLDPASSNLIKYFPANIFQEITQIYIAFLLVELLTWKLSSFIYHRSHS